MASTLPTSYAHKEGTSMLILLSQKAWPMTRACFEYGSLSFGKTHFKITEASGTTVILVVIAVTPDPLFR